VGFFIKTMVHYSLPYLIYYILLYLGKQLKTSHIMTRHRQLFDEKYKDFTDSEIQKELLFVQINANSKLKSIKKNTTIIVALIIIPLIAGLIISTNM